MAEIAFEALAAGIEATRGTLIDPPTHYFALSGTLTPMQEWYMPEESRGTLVRTYRQKAVRQWGEWSAEGGADPEYLPFLLNLAIGAGVIATPTNGVLTRTHTHKPAITSDAIKTGSFWFGDPNVQLWSAALGYLTELTISADASSTDGVTVSASGQTQYPAEDSTTLPAQTIGSLLMPGKMQVWIDTASAIGTTEITGRVVSAEFSLATNVVSKFIATGPTGSLTYSRIGRGRPEVSSTVTMEIPDTTQMDQALAGTNVKMRVRISGDLIESVTPDYYEYVQWDVYGPLKFDSWGDLEGTNRTAVFRVDTQYDSTLGADYQVVVQNQNTTV